MFLNTIDVEAQAASIALQADAFDGLLVQVIHPGISQDTYCVQACTDSFGQHYEAHYLSPKSACWRSASNIPIDASDFVKAVERNPCITLFDISELKQTSEFIAWLGLNSVSALLFFCSVMHWQQYDYPKAYILWLWHHRKSLPLNARSQAVSKNLVNSVSYGFTKAQLKNIRKLETDTCDATTIIEAIDIIHKEPIVGLQKWCSHQKSINPKVLIWLVGYPECLKAKWLQPVLKNDDFYDYSMNLEPLVLEAFRRGKKLGKTESYSHFFEKTIKSVLHLKQLHAKWQSELKEENRKARLKKIKSSRNLAVSPFIENEYFKAIKTAGELRKAAVYFKNCAAESLQEAISGEHFYYRYSNPKTAEQGLMMVLLIQLEPEKVYHCGDFLGYGNERLSDQAAQHYRQWQALNKSGRLLVCLDVNG